MQGFYREFVRPAAFLFDAERMHRAALAAGEAAGKSGTLRRLAGSLYSHDSGMSVDAGSVRYPGVAGLAAGYDKYGQLLDIFPQLGASHEELGTITPYERDGSKRPRLFRLPDDYALINRMGLNNLGVVKTAKLLDGREFSAPLDISFDPNMFFIEDTEQEEARAAILAAREKLWKIPYAKTLNISCPNTGDGKAFEELYRLDELLGRTDRMQAIAHRDVYVKFSHDLSDEELGELIDICCGHEVTGFVIGNTSNSRAGLSTPRSALDRIGAGGLSGLPLIERKLQMIRFARKKTIGAKVIKGVGGIGCNLGTTPAWDTYRYLQSGAHMVQVLTGIPYRGFGIFREISEGLPRLLSGYTSMEDYFIRRD